MKSFRMTIRSFRDAFKSVVRNFSLSLASITCITITLIIIAASFLISENVRNFTTLIEKDVTIVAFLDNDTTELDRENFEDNLKKMDNIDYYNYTSKQEVKDKLFPSENESFELKISEKEKLSCTTLILP